jgi:predicted NAD/FAD-dependent oxidoreductase
LRGKEGLASSELGRFSCEFELATFGPAKAISLNRALIQFLVGGTDLVKDLFQEFECRWDLSLGKGGAGDFVLLWQEEWMEIAILGAGISGLVCARAISAKGHRVVVLEKSRSLGGRCSSRKFGEHVVDTGVQYFTLRDPGVREEVEKLAGEQLRKIEAPILLGGEIYRKGEERFYLAKGNNRIGSLLADGVEVRKEVEVKEVLAVGKKWRVEGELYDGVVSSAPWPQSASLFGMRDSEVAFEPNLTACVEYLIPWDGLKYATLDSTGEEPLAWVGCENAKEGRIQSGKSVYVIQASTTYSRENLEKEPESWVQDLCEKVEARWGFDPAQRGTTLGHRWRYARRRGEPTGVPTMKDGIFLCGDSESDSRFESVWKSGTKVAQDVLDALG